MSGPRALVAHALIRQPIPPQGVVDENFRDDTVCALSHHDIHTATAGLDIDPTYIDTRCGTGEYGAFGKNRGSVNGSRR